MNHKESRKLFYVLRRITGRVIPGAYILYVAGVFDPSVVEVPKRYQIPTLALIIVLWIVWTLIKDYIKNVMDDKKTEIKPRQRGAVEGLQNLMPWLLLIVIALGIRMGVANMFIHIMVFASTQAGASLFYSLERYHYWEMVKGGY